MKRQLLFFSIACLISMQYAPIRAMTSADFNEIFQKETAVVIDRNDSDFVKLYSRAHESDVDAMYEVAKGYMKCNIVIAHSWCEGAADRGHAGALYVLGWMYETGNGVMKNYNMAYQRYEMAAKQGSTRAMNRLGSMYEKGQGTFWPRNPSRARYWYEQAVALGDITEIKCLDALNQEEERTICGCPVS